MRENLRVFSDGALPADSSPTVSLRLNFTWAFAGNVAYAACQWGILVALAKLFDPAMVGQFTLGLSVSAPIIMFSNLQLRQIQATDATRRFRFADYLGLRFVTTFLALAVLAGVVLVSGYRRETALVILIIGLAKAFESMSDVYYGLLQQHERMDRITKSLVLRGFLALAALVAGISLTRSLAGGLVGFALAWAIVLAAYDVRSPRFLEKIGACSEAYLSREKESRGRWGFDFRAWKTLVTWGVPLGSVMMLISLTTNIPRYFIENRLGESALGIFGSLAYLLTAGTVVVQALGQSASPRLARQFSLGDRRAFGALLLKLSGIGFLLGAAGILFVLLAGRLFLAAAYRPEYAAHNDVLVWLMIAAAVSYVASFLGYGMTAARRFFVQLPLFVVVAGATFVACLFLVPSRGLKGAAIAVLVSSAIQAIGSLAVILRALARPGLSGVKA